MAQKKRAQPMSPKRSAKSNAATAVEYRALPLSAYCNAGNELLPTGQKFPTGHKTYHGLPFLMGAPGARRAKSVIVRGGNGGDLSPVTITLPPAQGTGVRHAVFAHRLLESQLLKGAPVGAVCVDYVFTYADGTAVKTPMRERLEIAIAITEWGQWPILAWGDRKDFQVERDHGPWNDAGQRQAECFAGRALDFWLWVWVNPHPEKQLRSITLVPQGPQFCVGGITLGYLDEFPINRAAKRAVKLVIKDKALAGQPFNLTVDVDRGNATFPYPLPKQTAQQFLDDDLKGWGQARNEQASPAYVEIAATPSATITVKQGNKTVGSVRWSDLEQKKKLTPTAGLQLILVDEGRNWVKTTVVDDETNLPVPCRIHFRSVQGIPYQPHGHHDHIVSDLGSWHIDVGGDLRLGQTPYAYITGVCEGWLPRGEILVDIARGHEYEPIRQAVTIKPGQQTLQFRLKRIVNMAKQRYFSGDTHVHFLSTQGSHREAAGEGLQVVNLLLSQWGQLFTNTEEFTGTPSISPDGETVVHATQENRQHILGHLTLLGLKEPINPWCSGGPDEAELGGNLETTLSHWADRCHAQGGTVVLPHIPNPNCEPAALITTGRVDVAEMIDMSEYKHLEYYRYLNCGYKLPIAGGTDKMSSEVPVGMYRTYVHIPASEPFTYENWCKYLRAGNTFHSGGPLMWLKVDGKTMGDTADLPGNGGEVEVHATAISTLPITVLEIVINGEVVARTTSLPGVKELHIKERLKVTKHSWIAARCAGGKSGEYFDLKRHHDCWTRGLMAHTSPVYLAVGEPWWMFDPGTANYLITLMHSGLDFINTRSPQWKKGTVTHHHGQKDHLAFLSAPFKQGIAALHKRMHDLKIPH